MKENSNLILPPCSPKGPWPWLDVPPCYSASSHQVCHHILRPLAGCRASSSTLGHRFCGPSSCHCILSTSWAFPSCWLYQVSLWEKCDFRGTTPSLGCRWCSSPSPAAHTGPCSGGSTPVAIPMRVGHNSALMHTKGSHSWSSGSDAAHSPVRRGDKWLWLWQQSQVFSG